MSRLTTPASPGRSRIAARAALATGLGALAYAGSAVPAIAAPAVPAGLYGAQDPTFDGVFRQSLTVLALHGAGVAPNPSAITWLLAQQCADGGFPSFRADPAKACTAATEDSNATAVAAQALVAVARSSEAARATTWITRHLSTKDGGIGYNPGGASDANSTGLALSALAATGAAVAAAPGPVDALRPLQLGCSAAEDVRGALDYQVQKTPAANDSATAQAVLGLAGKSLPLPATVVGDDSPVLDCPPGTADAASLASAGAGFLARRLTATGGALPSAFGSGIDYGTTADAVLALIASGHGASAIATSSTRLASVATTWPRTTTGADRPAGLAKLALVAEATGADARAFGGTDLLARLQRTLTTATIAPSPSPSPSGTPAQKPATRAATTTPTSVTGGASTTGGGTLPATGAPVEGLLAAGGGLLLAGGALLVLARRRRTT